jgi:hypothetical protein
VVVNVLVVGIVHISNYFTFRCLFSEYCQTREKLIPQQTIATDSGGTV